VFYAEECHKRIMGESYVFVCPLISSTKLFNGFRTEVQTTHFRADLILVNIDTT
jgi:hypothetical protein